ncbi:apoptotic protease-activating factor 1-like [Amphiura filiformis]|uniref:apoptotic protease-activating factor 1-like n=1 Tax=Amphiura filiformis TaxID=82378 RepID=UPI003B20D7C4
MFPISKTKIRDLSLSERARSILLVNRATIAQDLNVEAVIDQLIADEILVPEDAELIRAEVTGRRRATKLLDMVMKKGQNGYNCLHKALIETHKHLAIILEDGVTEDGVPRSPSASPEILTCDEVDVILIRGGVPPRVPVFVNRPNDTSGIQCKMKVIKDKIGWVMVHGMGGIGKSVLAAEALRNSKILANCFPGGVFWLSIGQVDKNKLLMKVQNLCARLDQEPNPPPYNIDEGKDRLRTIFLEQHPRSLLVLDDVWSVKVAKTFDIQCRVLVTTRDSSITDQISSEVHKVSLESGFNETQALETLALWTERTVATLPPQAHEIYKASKGSPLVISLIGSLLKDHPHRWESYLKKLQEKKYSRLRKASSYEYESVDEAMGMSLEQLAKDSKDLYSDFAIFDEDVKVPAKVLSIMWDEDLETVEDEMYKLVQKSLLRQEWDDDLLCMTFSVHDLQRDFLKQNTENQRQLHVKLVKSYYRICGGKYHELEDDSYVHQYLPMHMGQALMTDQLKVLLHSLEWLKAKINIVGPSAVLGDFIKYAHMLECESSLDYDIAQEFQSFVSINTHLLVQSPKPDLYQLALNQPESTQVYKQALQKVEAASRGFYVMWRNRPPVMDSILMTSKVHDGIVSCAKFSPDGETVVSCGEDETVKVWESGSGQQLVSTDSHTDYVSWCDYSPDGALIASCSHDKTVRIWNSKDGRCMKTLKGHEEEVYMCVFSHDGTKIASCSQDWTLKIWDVKTGKELKELTCHTAAVKVCCFSPDDSKIATCSDDMTVKICDVSEGEIAISYEKHGDFVSCCCFSPNGRRIASSADNEIHIWQVDSGEQIGRCESRSTSILCCAYSPSDGVIAGGLSDFSVWLWDSHTFKPLTVYKGHTSWVLSVSFDKEGQKLVSASDDQTVMIWKVSDKESEKSIILKREFAVEFGEEDTAVVASDTQHRCLIIKGNNTVPIPMSQGTSRVRSVALSSDRRAACGCDDGQIKLLSIADASQLQELKGHKGSVRCCVFTKDASVLVSASDDNTIRVWNLEQGTSLELAGHSGWVTKIRLFHNDTRILSSSHDGSLRIWDLSSGKQLKMIIAHTDTLLSCDLSPDETMAASVSVDKTTKIWAIAADGTIGQIVHSLQGHEDSVRTCCFSPDSKYLATGDDQGVVKIWNVKTGELQGSSQENHNSWVTDIKFAANSRKLVSVGDNVKWWDLDGNILQTFHIRGSLVRLIHPNQDFTQFVTIDNAGQLYVLQRI